MRYVVCLIIGLVIGAIAASTAGNAFARRHAWPRAVMNVMQHELGTARSAARGSQCATPAMADASAHLKLLGGDLERALLAPDAKDRVFSRYASDMRDTVAKWDVTADCPRQAEALTAISNACDACHRDYR